MAVSAELDEAEFIRNRQQQEQFQQQIERETNAHVDEPKIGSAADLVVAENETPCAVIEKIAVSDQQFAFVLPQLVKRIKFRAGMCLGSQSLENIQKTTQNVLIDKGLITTQAAILSQGSDDKILTLTVIPGRVEQIRFVENQGSLADQGKISTFSNKFPQRADEILNLHDLEQGLENLRRLPSVTANIRIEPGEETNSSQVIVDWQQKRPIHFSMGAHDGGSTSTGKYQGTATLFFDNPLGLSDLFYLTYSRDLGHKTSLTDADGKRTKSGNHGYGLHYSVPFEKWLLSWNHNAYRYHEATEGLYTNYDYNGKSYNSNVGLSRVIFRNGNHKNMLGVKLWSHASSRYIDDIQLDVHQRRMAGWQLDWSHRAQLGRWQVSGTVSFKRGTGMRGSLPAPEQFNADDGSVSGTSRMKVISAKLDAIVPFQLGKQIFSFDTGFNGQWNKTPLVPQDKLSIGGRYTVRGFDGENSLSGERGWYWQNNLNWHFLPTHQLYLGVDGGRVSGESVKYWPQRSLVGGVLGLRGSQSLGGRLSYDVFIGKPFKKPKFFQSAKKTYGFSVDYAF